MLGLWYEPRARLHPVKDDLHHHRGNQPPNGLTSNKVESAVVDEFAQGPSAVVYRVGGKVEQLAYGLPGRMVRGLAEPDSRGSEVERNMPHPGPVVAPVIGVPTPILKGLDGTTSPM